MAFSDLKEKRDDLVLAVLDLAILARPYDPDYELPESIAQADGSLITTLGSDGWLKTGEIQKKAGLDITPDSKFNDIEGYGSKAPRRRIKESESISLEFTAQEARKLNLSMYYDVSLSAWQNIPGGVSFTKRSDGDALYWSILAIGVDRYNGSDIMPFWQFGKMSVDKAGKLSLVDNAEMALPVSLLGLEHPTAGLYKHGIVGPGWLALSQAAGFTGLAGAPWTVSVTGGPSGGTFTLSIGGQTTSGIAYNATASAVQSALAGLSSVGTGNVTVTGSAGGPYTVTFAASVTGTLTGSGTGLTGGTTPSVAVSQAAG